MNDSMSKKIIMLTELQRAWGERISENDSSARHRCNILKTLGNPNSYNKEQKETEGLEASTDAKYNFLDQ